MNVSTDHREEMTDEEQLEADGVLEAIGEFVEREENGVSTVNGKRFRDFSACESLLRRALHGRAIKFEVIPHGIFSSVGVIRVTMKNMTVLEPEVFARAVRLASNYEIYPKTDGKIMFALTFYGMTDKIGE